MKFLNHLLHNLFAYNCISCGKAVRKNRNILCDKCSDKLMFSIPAEKPGVLSCVSYKEKAAKDLVLYMKDHKDPDAFSYAAELITYRIMRARLDNIEEYFITFAPRTPTTRLKKGFDQSQKIAQLVSLQIFGDKSKCVKLISRKFFSKQQKTLSSSGRQENSEKNFSLMKNADVPEKVIVIDDLTTTGATLERIKKLLLKGGAKECVLVTLAVNE